jgi:hypothetical protein
MPAIPKEYTPKTTVAISSASKAKEWDRNKWRKEIEEEILTLPAQPVFFHFPEMTYLNDKKKVQIYPEALKALSDSKIIDIATICRNYKDLSNNLKSY